MTSNSLMTCLLNNSTEFLQESDGHALGLLLKELKIEEKDDKEILKKLKSTPVDEIMEVLPRLAEVSIILAFVCEWYGC